jgi:LmbE family N-acetylglucosaminyl deacetylase
MKVLMLLAHADDEIILGWPILQDSSIEKEIIICSSDLYNSTRKWCAHRKYVLFDICAHLNIPVTCLDYSSEFYRLETRKEALSKAQNEIAFLIKERTYDKIFTHNPMGEYGHLDHKMLFDITLRYSEKPILITDICLESNWPSLDFIPKRMYELYYTNKIEENIILDEELYAYCEEQYRKYKVWTWSKDPVTRCNLYQL